MEPYYLKYIKDGPFQPKTTDGDAKPESQWTPNERRVVIQDQRPKSINMSCLPDDLMEYVISCVLEKETWTDLTREQIKEEKNRALQSINETLAQKATKRRKLNEEVEDLKRHLEIMPDEDDDVYTETTPLARKNQMTIYMVKQRSTVGSYWNHVVCAVVWKPQRPLNLGNWVWSLVKERFSTSKPNNFSNDYLLTTLGAMFERSDGQAQVWKSQRSVYGQAKDEGVALMDDEGAEKKAEEAQGASPNSEVMPLTFQPHSPKESPCLGIMKHTKPETQDSSNKSVSGTVTVNETKQITPSVPIEVKDTEQESKLNELTKLVQMLIDEKVNSNQKTQESTSKIQKTESSKSVDS
nr:retrovirus-related Pol polyprotein from transposon TNT 1-94 [Tanacetum cinerariifolium]